MFFEIDQIHILVGYGWLVVALCLFVLEAGTPGLFFFLSFAIGSIFAAPASFLQYPFSIQTIIWLIGSTLSLVLLKSYAKKNAPSFEKTNIDALIGQQATVIITIEYHGIGYIKVRGEEWPAITKDKNILHKGTPVIVVGIEGNKLIVDRKYI